MFTISENGFWLAFWGMIISGIVFIIVIGVKSSDRDAELAHEQRQADIALQMKQVESGYIPVEVKQCTAYTTVTVWRPKDAVGVDE